MTDHSEPTAQPETDAAGIARVMEAVYDYRDEDTRENRERVEQAVRLYGIGERIAVLDEIGCVKPKSRQKCYEYEPRPSYKCDVCVELDALKQQRDQMNAKESA
jgi:hypothetical protein